MANVKISELGPASTPLAGTEVLPIVQSSATVKVSVANLTAGRAVAAASLTTTGTINNLTVGYGAGAVSSNTAVGVSALASNTTGSLNVAVGDNALPANTTGSDNTAVGRRAGQFNTTGSQNTMLGVQALGLNTSGAYNIAVGVSALQSNTTASYNTAVGYQAGYTLATVEYGTFVGATAGRVTTGASNTFIGTSAGESVTTGAKNTIIGRFAGNQLGLDISTTSNSIVLSDGDGNPRLYYFGPDSAWKSKEIYNNTSANSANMYIGSGYDIGRVTSALKYKQDVRDIESIDITKFRPVRYKSKCANDDQTKDYFGFIADEVADAGIEELVIRNADNEVESFAYDRMTVVLVKAIQELKAEFDAYKASHP
jgi:hypothetical protein